MTDERIREEFDKWNYKNRTEAESNFGMPYASITSFTDSIAEGFYSGFRSAERLSKIEALEEAVVVFANGGEKTESINKVLAMIAELKEGV